MQPSVTHAVLRSSGLVRLGTAGVERAAVAAAAVSMQREPCLHAAGPVKAATAEQQIEQSVAEQGPNTSLLFALLLCPLASCRHLAGGWQLWPGEAAATPGSHACLPAAPQHHSRTCMFICLAPWVSLLPES
jgi:hypothetical protein